MKPRNFMVLLVAMIFISAVGCKERAEETDNAGTAVKVQGQAVEKAESEEAEEGEEAAEEQMKVELPAAVTKAVKDNVPGAEIEILTVEKEGGISLYDIEFKAGMGEIEVAEDGTVIDVSSTIDMRDVPRAAAEAIQKAVEGGTIKQIEKSEVRAEIKMDGETGTIVRLEAPKYVYEAEFTKDGRAAEVQVAPDGTVVEASKWIDEEAIAADALPSAVRQALDKAYPGCRILQAEVTTEGGKTYEIQIQVDGKTMAVAVDPDGKIIK